MEDASRGPRQWNDTILPFRLRWEHHGGDCLRASTDVQLRPAVVQGLPLPVDGSNRPACTLHRGFNKHQASCLCARRCTAVQWRPEQRYVWQDMAQQHVRWKVWGRRTDERAERYSIHAVQQGAGAGDVEQGRYVAGQSQCGKPRRQSQANGHQNDESDYRRGQGGGEHPYGIGVDVFGGRDYVDLLAMKSTAFGLVLCS